MTNPRIYGNPPFITAVVHGGPGAAGEMVPVARELSKHHGVLEPIQTTDSLDGQIQELKSILQEYADPPVTLIGFSWGAWLVMLLTSRYPDLVGKLILVGSGPFQQQYAATIEETRMSRLSDAEQKEVADLIDKLNDPVSTDRDTAFARFGALYTKADAYDPLSLELNGIECRIDIFKGVWLAAAELRRSGRLLENVKDIQCPVVAIHGDHDSHPAEGVRKPLSTILKDFRFILLDKCGHKPWIERHARDRFYDVLMNELM